LKPKIAKIFVQALLNPTILLIIKSKNEKEYKWY
jgi:hypothetical protein